MVELERRLMLKRMAGVGMGASALGVLGFSFSNWLRGDTQPVPDDRSNIDQVEAYFNSIIASEKPPAVRNLVYDRNDDRRHARGAASVFAEKEALRYTLRFNEPGIVDELASLLKGSDLYANQTVEQRRKGISAHLASAPGRETIHDLIERHLRQNLQNEIDKTDTRAVAIKVPQGPFARSSQYDIYAFPRIFEPYELISNGASVTRDPIRLDIEADLLGAYYRKEFNLNASRR